MLSLHKLVCHRYYLLSMTKISNKKYLSVGCYSSQKSIKNNDSNKQSQVEVDGPKKFSMSQSHPSRMPLHRIVEEQNEESESVFMKIFRLSIIFGILGLAFYSIFLSDLNVEIEDKLTKDIPGYVDYMKKSMPDYEERLERARARKAAKNN